MQQSQYEDGYAPVDLREYLGVIRARKWTILLTVLLVLGLALAYSYRQEPVYRAQARLLLKPIPSTGYFPSVSLETESQLLRSDLVAERAAKILDREDPSSLLGGVSVSPVPESQVLEVFYSSTEPQEAASAANAFAEGFIEYQELQANQTIENQVKDLEEQLSDLETELNGVLAGIEQATEAKNATRLGRLRSQEAALSTRLGLLQQELDEIQNPGATASRDGGEVIQRASVPSEPYAPNHIANGLMGLLLGLGAGLGLAFLRQRLDDRFRGRSDVERSVEAPVLATVPKIRGRKRPEDRLVAVSEPHSGASESYRALRTGVLFTARQEGLKVFAVTSLQEGEGKTLTVANLAAATGQTGQTVALVSADMRRPTLETYFGVERGDWGLSSWLTGTEDVLPPLQQSKADNVDILTCGPIPRNPGELLTSPRLTELITELRRRYDYVLFDTPPVLAVADVTTLASMMDGTILVLDMTKTRRSQASHIREDLLRVGARLIGAVLNNYDPADSPYYYTQYRDTYSSNGSKGKRKLARLGRR